jgi:phosphoglycerate dehydrogenase-like enzyme
MDIFLHELSYARIADRLAGFPNLVPVLMKTDGTIWREGRQIDVSEARFEVAWVSGDAFTAGPLRDYLVACLKCPSLRWLQSGSAGVDGPVFTKLAAKGVALCNSNGNAIAIAEFVIAGVLDVLHPFAERRAAQAAHEWKRLTFSEIAGGTWVIVGMGNIGTEVAVRARAFGADVIGVRRTPRGDEPVDRMITPDQLAGMIPQADVVVLSAPANADTAKLVDADFLAGMKPGAGLVNIGRGALVDEPALLAALDRGTPAWAVLDVFETEPLPAESPFWDHPRVRITAHTAGLTDGTTARTDAIFLDNLGRFIAGTPLRLTVDPASLGVKP